MNARLTKSTKLAYALVLRDTALTVLTRMGTWETVEVARGAPGTRDMKVLSACLGNLHILYRTPFQRVSQPDDLMKYRAAQISPTVPQTLPYGLDLWAPKKVLNIEWDDRGNAVLVSLRHGAWETELIN